MKKIILSTLLASTALMATYSENAYIYKDPRIMGMGGVNVAVGGYASSVFSNPAGLRAIPKSHGFEMEILNVGVSGSANFLTFAQDMQDATSDSDSNEQTSAVTNVLSDYSGEYFQLSASNYTSISRNNDSTAFSIGLLESSDLNFISHGNGGVESPLELHGRAYGGLILGFAKSFANVLEGTLDIGIGTKFIYQQSFEGGLSISEITNNSDDFLTYLQDKYQKESEYFGIDLGATYSFLEDSFLKPKVGVSVLNLGLSNINMVTDQEVLDNYGKQVMTVNVGASVSPHVKYLGDIILGVDYVDLTNNQEIRSYTYGDNSVVVSKESADLMKKLRAGASLHLVDNPLAMLTLNGGLYQGEYTAGIDAQLTLLKLSVATYAEEVGPNVGDFTDRRVMANIGIGW